MSIKLYIDSVGDLTPELIKKLDAKLMSMTVVFQGEDKVYTDAVDINGTLLLQKVKELDVLPTTSAISPFAYEQYFKEDIEQGNQILYVCLGSKLSSTYRNACLARDEVDPNNIAIVDSGSLSTGISLLSFKARQLIDKGLCLEEIQSEVQKLAPKVNAKFSLDVLDYMYKGGRCSSISYYFGKLLHIHPILKMIDGELKIYDKPRGGYIRAINVQLDDFKKDLPNIDLETVFVTHCQLEQNYLDIILKKIKELAPEANVYVTEAGSTISSHCGPNTVGILYLLK